MMSRCTTCWALLGPDADWCGQCFATVRRRESAQARPSIAGTPATAPEVSPNGAAATPAPRTTGEPLLPPDILISLESPGSSRGLGLLGQRGRNWITAFIVVVAVGTDALFFPYVGYMLAYGVFVGAVSAFALWRLWGRAVR